VVHPVGHRVDAPEGEHREIQENADQYSVVQAQDVGLSGEGVPSWASLFQ
jgi:hypothetical protein